jgi:hypothetical protein
MGSDQTCCEKCSEGSVERDTEDVLLKAVQYSNEIRENNDVKSVNAI